MFPTLPTLATFGASAVLPRRVSPPLVGQTIAIHAVNRVVRQPGVPIERELRARLGEDWRKTIPAGVVLATATRAGMARVVYVDLMTGHAIHDARTEVGCAVGLGRTPIDPWGDFGIGRWLWFLADVRALPEPVLAVGHQPCGGWRGRPRISSAKHPQRPGWPRPAAAVGCSHPGDLRTSSSLWGTSEGPAY